MTRRVQLPDQTDDPTYLRRLVAELTQTLNGQQQRIETLEGMMYVETNLTRAPIRVGATAVVGSAVYISTGLTASDWVLVS